MVASRTQRQSKTATTPILILNAYNLWSNDDTIDEIDAILCNNNVNYEYSLGRGYPTTPTFLQMLRQFYKSDGYAGLSLNQYLHELYDR